MIGIIGLCVALGGFVYGLYFGFTRRRYGMGAVIMVLALGVGGSLISSETDGMAREAGWASFEDRTEAEKAGVTDPEEWERRKAEQASADAEQAQADAERAKLHGHHCLSAWDGTHQDFTAQVTRLLREPDSFEHIATRTGPVNEAGKNSISMEYRARNGFGGVNVSTATGWLDNATCAVAVVSAE